MRAQVTPLTSDEINAIAYKNRTVCHMGGAHAPRPGQPGQPAQAPSTATGPASGRRRRMLQATQAPDSAAGARPAAAEPPLGQLTFVPVQPLNGTPRVAPNCLPEMRAVRQPLLFIFSTPEPSVLGRSSMQSTFLRRICASASACKAECLCWFSATLHVLSLLGCFSEVCRGLLCKRMQPAQLVFHHSAAV